MMTARPASAVMVITLATALAAAPHAGSRSSAAPVPIHVMVHDARGAPASGLTRDDFDVRVDNQPRQVVSVAAAGTPALVILLDATQSIPWRSSQGQSLELFASSLRPTDRVRVGVIARTPKLADAPAVDSRQFVRQTRDLLNLPLEERQGPSPIWDATIGALEALRNEPGHRAVIVVTDGRASGNVVGLRDVAIHAIAAGISVSSVSGCEDRMLLSQTRTTAAGIAPGRQLVWLAQVTGGRCLGTPKQGPGGHFSVAERLGLIHASLRTAYVLEIATRPDDGPNPALTVQVIREGLTVQARRGFVSTRLP